MLNVKDIKKDFPIFERQPDLVYLDSAATALKPKGVIDAMNEYYFEYSANVARGLYPMAEGATIALEKARERVASFIRAETKDSIVFTANATHAINLVALGVEETITASHAIVVTDLEHHSNLLPWKELSKRTGAKLVSVPFTPEGNIDLEQFSAAIDARVALVAFSAVSNVFGVMNPVTDLVAIVRSKNKDTRVLVDACQAIGHFPVDIQTWDADFVVFSGHKLFGPTGIGVLTGKQSALTTLIPMNVGGGTVLDACSDVVRYKKLPENLEGGTPNIAGAIGLAAALDYVDALGLENIHAHERELAGYTIEKLLSAFGRKVHILGSMGNDKRAGIVSFALDSIHPHDVAHILGEHGICVRAGEHCASPLHRALSLPATTRVSLSIYNDTKDIDALVTTLKKAHSILGH